MKKAKQKTLHGTGFKQPSKPKKSIQTKNKAKNIEVDAYIFLKEKLRNPGRNPEGQVYTQNEYLSHSEIRTFLGQERPENIVKITESKFWIIEAKKEHRQLQQALNEAKEYAVKINESKNIKVKLISGVAGNHDDTYLIRTMFFDGIYYVPITIDDRGISDLFSPAQVPFYISRRLNRTIRKTVALSLDKDINESYKKYCEDNSIGPSGKVEKFMEELHKKLG